MALHKDVRRQRAFEEFKRKLDDMSPDQIRTMLEERRIRSSERIELAEARLKEREKAAAGTAGAAARARSRADGDGHDQGRKAQAADAAAAGGAVGTATATRAGEEVPMARQVGRMLGIGLGVASLAALAVFAIRR